MAKNNIKKDVHEKLLQATKGGLYGIGAQFVLGTIVALWHIPPSEETATHKSPFFASLSFDLHMLLALFLVIGAVFLTIFAWKSGNKGYQKSALFCLISIVVAFLGGASIFYAPEALVSLGLFFMGIGFLAAFIFYWKLYMAVR